MAHGVHEVPRPLQDEDKWAKLTKRQWVICLPALVLIYLSVTFFYKIKMLPIGIALSVVILCLAVILAFLELPPEKYLFGTGVKLEKLAIRLIKKRLPKNRKIYTKNYENGCKEWMKKL